MPKKKTSLYNRLVFNKLTNYIFRVVPGTGIEQGFINSPYENAFWVIFPMKINGLKYLSGLDRIGQN